MPTGTLKVGNVEIIGVSDAICDLRLDQFWPTLTAEDWRPYRERYPAVFGGENVWRSDIGCYLIRTPRTNVLVDTGVGPSEAPFASYSNCNGTLPDRLREHGVTTEDVSTVVFTHLHPDHVGWNFDMRDEKRPLVFPRARHVIHLDDWNQFMKPEVQAAFPVRFVDALIKPLETTGLLDLIEGDVSVTDEITTLHTPGHTPGHICVIVSSGGEKVIIWGDAFLHPAQITEPDWGSPFPFDQDAEQAQICRHSLLDRIEADGMTIAACHFPEPGFGRIARLEGRRYWQPAMPSRGE